jgi:hypothetical protein
VIKVGNHGRCLLNAPGRQYYPRPARTEPERFRKIEPVVLVRQGSWFLETSCLQAPPVQIRSRRGRLMSMGSGTDQERAALDLAAGADLHQHLDRIALNKVPGRS